MEQNAQPKLNDVNSEVVKSSSITQIRLESPVSGPQNSKAPEAPECVCVGKTKVQGSSISEKSQNYEFNLLEGPNHFSRQDTRTKNTLSSETYRENEHESMPRNVSMETSPCTDINYEEVVIERFRRTSLDARPEISESIDPQDASDSVKRKKKSKKRDKEKGKKKHSRKKKRLWEDSSSSSTSNTSNKQWREEVERSMSPVNPDSVFTKSEYSHSVLDDSPPQFEIHVQDVSSLNAKNDNSVDSPTPKAPTVQDRLSDRRTGSNNVELVVERTSIKRRLSNLSVDFEKERRASTESESMRRLGLPLKNTHSYTEPTRVPQTDFEIPSCAKSPEESETQSNSNCTPNLFGRVCGEDNNWTDLREQGYMISNAPVNITEELKGKVMNQIREGKENGKFDQFYHFFPGESIYDYSRSQWKWWYC